MMCCLVIIGIFMSSQRRRWRCRRSSNRDVTTRWDWWRRTHDVVVGSGGCGGKETSDITTGSRRWKECSRCHERIRRKKQKNSGAQPAGGGCTRKMLHGFLFLCLWWLIEMLVELWCFYVINCCSRGRERALMAIWQSSTSCQAHFFCENKNIGTLFENVQKEAGHAASLGIQDLGTKTLFNYSVYPWFSEVEVWIRMISKFEIVMALVPGPWREPEACRNAMSHNLNPRTMTCACLWRVL